MTHADPYAFSVEALRSRRTTKWHKFDPDVLPAWVADMDFGVAPPVLEALQKLIDAEEFGYSDRGGALEAAFVRRMLRRFGWETHAADVHPIGDLVQASFAAVTAFSEPGDGVVLQLPSYPPFQDAITGTGRRIVANPMRRDGKGWRLDLGAFDANPDPKAKVLIFCHPQNPTGRAFTEAELAEVAAFAVRHDLVVVSDEIHADILYDGRRHRPLASMGPEIAARTLTITSATKGYNIPALRTAAIHFGSPALRQRFFARLPAKLLGFPSVMGIDATVAAWDAGDPWFAETLARLEANRDYLARAIPEALPGAVFLPPEATYLAWIDCTALDLGMPAQQFFLERARVGLNAGETFGSGYDACVRLNFATTPAILQEIVGRMADAVRQR